MPLRALTIAFLLACLSVPAAPVLADTASDAKVAPAARAAAKDAPKDATKDKAAAEEPEVDPDKLRNEAFARGKRAYDRGDWLKAIFDLRPLAEWGDDRAMILLGNMYAAGNGVNKDDKEAFQLYHRAAVSKNMNLDGMVATAAMYQTGKGVNINTRLAIGWFERAAKLGSQPAAFFYAIHRFQGSKGTTYDLKADHAEAYKWFRIAATKGTDKKLRRAAYEVSEKLAAKLPPDRVIEMNQAASDWAPSTPADIGPDPEAILVEEMKKKGETLEEGQMPEEKPQVVPKPEKPKDEGESLIPPE
jgi:TPR repeat protein